MRFEVGQIVPFVNVSFHARHNVDPFQAAWLRLYHPEYHILDGIEVKLLEVTEHHKVPGEWDDALTNDGFILRDTATDEIWHNQYPKASYGQLDDSLDRIATRKHDHFTQEEVDAMGSEELETLLRGWQTGLSMLGALYRALNGRERERLELADDIRAQFESYHDQLKSAVEQAAGKRVEYRELEIGDPKRVVENCWRAQFVEDDVTKAAA